MLSILLIDPMFSIYTIQDNIFSLKTDIRQTVSAVYLSTK